MLYRLTTMLNADSNSVQKTLDMTDCVIRS